LPGHQAKTQSTKVKSEDLALLVAENAAAISDGVHSNRKGYDRFYKAFCDAMSGFPGIWTYCAECGLELERQRPNAKNPDGWIEAVFEVQKAILQTADANYLPPKIVVQKALARLKIKEKHESKRAKARLHR
jgi:hypothetical protein